MLFLCILLFSLFTACTVQLDTHSTETEAQSVQLGNPSTEGFLDKRNGKFYPTTVIGSQIWTGKNLHYPKYGYTDYRNTCFDYTENGCEEYGMLYDYNESQGYMCPIEYHLPTLDEWYTLLNTIYTETTDLPPPTDGMYPIGNQLIAPNLWEGEHNTVPNHYQFWALPTNNEGLTYQSDTLPQVTYFMTATKDISAQKVYTIMLNKDTAQVILKDTNSLQSIRCVKDSPEPKFYGLYSGRLSMHDTLKVGSTVDHYWATDAPYDALTFSIAAGNEKGYFNMSSNGVLYLKQSLIESKDTLISLTVAVTDGTHTTTATQSYSIIKSILDIRDSHRYPFRTIGTQIWMVQNIQYSPDSSAYCPIEGLYGCAYQWHEAMGLETEYAYEMYVSNTPWQQGICPSDWHIPSIEEWTTLQTFIEEHPHDNHHLYFKQYQKFHTPFNDENDDITVTSMRHGSTPELVFIDADKRDRDIYLRCVKNI